MLACARIGAPHSVIFGGFAPESLRDRINDCGAKVVITADGGYRRGGIVPLKKNIDEALKECPQRQDGDRAQAHRPGRSAWQQGRDVWWDDFVKGAAAYCPPEPMDSEDLLYLLYTSGSTGKPKGIIHTTGGYLTGVTRHPPSGSSTSARTDVYWCTADIGWVTGHSYIVYGPLANGATTVMYEGTPDYPDKDRFWRIIEKYGVTILYTAPTAIRTFMRWGDEYPNRCDLSSLRLLGIGGRADQPRGVGLVLEGHRRRPLPGGGHLVADRDGPHPDHARCPGITVLKPGSATLPFPGIDAEVVNDKGEPAQAGLPRAHASRGRACCAASTAIPSASSASTGARYPGIYFTGDGAKRDEDGYFWLLGRVDDVMNVSGHRVSTMEVESALVDHPAVAEAAVIGRPHEIKGQAIAAFVTIKDGITQHRGAHGRAQAARRARRSGRWRGPTT